MLEKIKADLEEIKNSSSSNLCNNPHYIKRLEELVENFSFVEWIKTGQHHNARLYTKSFPKVMFYKGVEQVIRFGGGYVIQVLGTNFIWEDCVGGDMDGVIRCLWMKENNIKE
tara:strand:+ start:445 stop:783 length:339 start_codon:yes stop_codon:yes gene_type:complete